MKEQYPIRLGFLILLLAGSGVFGQSPRLPVNWKGLPEPYHTESASNGPRMVPRPAGAQLKVPEGFRVKEFASGFTKPRFMLVGSAGEILLSDSGERGSPTGAVYALKGGNRKTILQNLDRPYGMAFYQDYLYVGEPTSIKRYKYRDMAISGEGEEVFSLEGFGKGHWTRTLLFDRQQKKLYVTVGSGSDHDKGDPPLRATINRINPDGGAHEVVGRGLRNTVGLRWRPGTDELWAAVQERDGLGDDLVPDFLIHVQQGGFYGWPHAYTGPHKEPRHEETNQKMVDKTLYPDVVLGAHVSAMDILFYDGTQFPGKVQGRAIPRLSRLLESGPSSWLLDYLHPLRIGPAHLRSHRFPHRLDDGPRQSRGLGTTGRTSPDARRVDDDLGRWCRKALACVLFGALAEPYPRRNFAWLRSPGRRILCRALGSTHGGLETTATPEPGTLQNDPANPATSPREALSARTCRLASRRLPATQKEVPLL